jgi:hypothetical protein
VIGGIGTVAIAVVVVAAMVRYEPAFYASADADSDPSQTEALARRLLSKASSIHAATGRSGAWDAAISDAEVNAWLAIDLPRNHSRLLPDWLSAPRVAFSPHHVHAGARFGSGWMSVVGWVDLEVRLRGANQIGLALLDARLGAVPLPRAAILREVARRLTACGLVTDLRRLDDRPLLVVSVPATSAAAAGRLDSFAVADGEVLLAGGAASARSGGEGR